MGIKVAHVEAGLRSFDRSMPEEINRIVTDSISDLLLTPSEDGNENLQREGVDEGKVKLVGNVMIDALLENLELARKCAVESCLGIEKQGFAYVTLHRPSNVDTAESLIPLMSELRGLSERIPVVFPMHPRTRARCAQFGISISGSTGLKLMEPVGYNESLWLTENARLVLTDSGGLQEESTYFRTPCLTLRPNTERPITIRMGSNKLTSLESLSKDIGDVFEREPRFGTIPPLWDGCAAERIVNALMAGSR
jgi:UDP-N-acetylglucosamine 2-epimerase (non-hydrolysing)